METVLEEYTYSNALADVDARLKLLLGVGAITIVVMSGSVTAPLWIAVSMALITVLVARIPAGAYLRLLSIPFLFAGSSALVLLFTAGGGAPVVQIQIGWILFVVTEGSIGLAALVLCRTFGGMCALLFIALTTPMIDLIAVLRWMRLPKEFIDLAMLVYRFIFVLIGEAIAIHNAQVMRHGYSRLRNAIRSFPMLGGMLFIRSWERGEELIVAMDARCYDGELGVPESEGRLTCRGAAAVGCYLACALALAWVCGGLPA
jgi:cobalt ECF transporter T component CbiQ